MASQTKPNKQQRNATDLEKVLPPGTLTDERPDFIPRDDYSGTEQIGNEDIKIPRIATAQKQSPQLEEGKPEYIDGLKYADMYNTLTGEKYGRGPIEFTVVRVEKARGIEFKPFDEGGGIVDRNVDAHDPRMFFGPDGEKPRATKFLEFLVILWPSRKIMAMSFKGSSLDAATSLRGLLKSAFAPIYATRYLLSTSSVTNDKGTFSVFNVKPVGENHPGSSFIREREQYEFAKSAFESLKDKEVKIDRDEAPETPGPDDTPF